MRVRRQRKVIDISADNVLRFGEHLTFGDPERRLGHTHSEIVDFDTVELRDGNLDGIQVPLKPH